MNVKIKRIYLVKCPHCGREQKFETEGYPVNKYKKCINCEKVFCVHRNPLDTAIVKELGARRVFRF